MSSTTPLSDPRVVITTHKEDGTSVFQSDQTLQPFKPFGPSGSGFSVFDTRSAVPVSNAPAPLQAQESAAGGNTVPRCPPNGVVFCVTDIAPNFTVPMHRTASLDYGVVLSGEIVLALDGGEAKTVRQGEFLVQGGANHTWTNRTDQPCRIACVMVGAEKVKLASGEVLEETVLKR